MRRLSCWRSRTVSLGPGVVVRTIDTVGWRVADDYVTKPVAPKELTARIRALLRRARPPEPEYQAIRAGRLEIRPEEGVVRLDGVEVDLTRTEFRLLAELAQNAGRVLSREQL